MSQENTERLTRLRSDLKFTSVPNHVLEDYASIVGLDGIGFYAVLKKFADYSSGECYPKMGTLAALTGMSIRSVQRKLDSLVKCGLLTKESGQEKGSSNVYTFTLPSIGGKTNLSRGYDKSVLPGKTNLSSLIKEELEPLNENQLTLSPPSSETDDLNIPKLFEYFCQQAGKTSNYTLTPKRRRAAESRWREAKRIAHGDIAEAKQLFRRAIDALCESEFMRKQGLLEWDQVFRSEDNFTKWVDRWESQSNAQA